VAEKRKGKGRGISRRNGYKKRGEKERKGEDAKGGVK
jgi:hypothetical protein